MISPTLKSFLSLVAWSEGTSTSDITQDDGYDVIVTGVDGTHLMSDYLDHPFSPQYNRPPVVIRKSPLLQSTAAGRYQLLYRWWPAYKKQLGLNDFGHDAQDAVAVQQIKEKNAIETILDGDITSAIKACSNIWASFPGNSYGQHSHSMGILLDQYSIIRKES